jgi:two-component system sensor histidine kinase UhpB
LKELTEDIALVAPFKINYAFDNLNESILSEQEKIMLFRITQEQLNNTIKHSNANNVCIHLMQKDNLIVLIIRDDGVGFDTDIKAEGIGLKNIRSRIEFYNGNMLIETSPGNGCNMIITLPK